MPFDPTLRRLIAGFRKAPQWDEELDLQLLRKLWPLLVGTQIAELTTVTAVQGSRVVVNVPDKVWRVQLVQMKPELLARMNEPWPAPWIQEIAFTYED